MVRWSPQGDQLASIARDGTLRLWKAGFSRQVRTAGGDTFSALAVSGDGRWLASDVGNDRTCVWDAETLRPRHDLDDGEVKVSSLAFLNADRWLAQLNGVGRLRLWDLERGAVYDTTQAEVQRAARHFSPEPPANWAY